MTTTKDKMHGCQLYDPNDEAIMREQALCLEKQYDYNYSCKTHNANNF